MKKLLCTLLCAALLGGAASPALAADSADARLAKVTQAVKARLGLDTEEYESFHGSSEEQELVTLWSLEWSGQNGSLSIEALEDGTVVSYRLYEPSAAGEPGAIPSFPAGDTKTAVSAAEAFLKKVLNEKETVRLGSASGEDRLGSTSYRFSGEIQLSGLPSPLSYSLTVRAEDGQVTRFWRDVPATVCVGGVPDAAASVSAAQAAESLKKTQALRLEYVLDDNDSGRAVLRYVPDDLHTFYVDARTGEAVDLTELQKGSWERGGNGMSAGDAAAPEAAAGLSEAEQAGIRKLEGVLDTAALDTALRAVQEYGLGRYTLGTASYRLTGDGDSEQVLCTLRYSRTADEGKRFRTVTVDARTGEVVELWSSAPWDEDSRPALSVQQAQERAEAFLKAHYGAHYEALALYDTVDSTGEGSPSYSFTFARRQNDIFFPANAYSVGIDAQDGSVSHLSFTYDESVEFDSTDGLVSVEAALDAWMGTYDVTLRYLFVPEKLDRADASAARLIDMGMTHFNAMKLGYMLECDRQARGVDAKTGEPVFFAKETPAREYSDLAGHWAKDDVERLARFGIGYDAERFQPDKALTQLDAVCLLASLQGQRLDPESADKQEKDQAYAVAYSMGALTRQQRQEDAVLTRGELVRLLLNGAGYGKTASLKGIFTCSYADRASIAEADLGYAALAQGLGLVRGSYQGAQTATRAEAAIMLVRLMES